MPPCPLISIIIPTYNGERWIGETLESLVAQHDSSCLQVVVIDDGSIDGTLSLVEKYSDVLNMRILRRHHHGNWVRNTNYAISVADGDWICWLHQDDRWSPNRLAILQKWISLCGATLNWAIHPVHYINENGKRIGTLRLPKRISTVEHVNPEILVSALTVQNFIATPAVIYRRDLVATIGEVDEDLWYTADWDYWLRIAQEHSCGIIAAAISDFRIHSGAQTVRDTKNDVTLRDQFDHVLSGFQDKLDNRVLAAAEFSKELNLFLLQGRLKPIQCLFSLLYRFYAIGGVARKQFLDNSRIGDRLIPRMRAFLRLRSVM